MSGRSLSGTYLVALVHQRLQRPGGSHLVWDLYIIDQLFSQFDMVWETECSARKDAIPNVVAFLSGRDPNAARRVR